MAFAASNLRSVQASVTRRHSSLIQRSLNPKAPRTTQCTCSVHSGSCAKHGRRQDKVVARAAADVEQATVSATPSIKEILAANEKFQRTFNCDLPAPPSRKLAIVTCMDARIHPEAFMGFDIGDAHVIRNAGGRVSIDALRSLVISQRMLGTQEVLVIHHTGCGMVGLQDSAVYEKVGTEVGAEGKDVIDGFDFMGLGQDAEENVRKDVQVIKDCKAISDDIPVFGFIYNVETGHLDSVN